MCLALLKSLFGESLFYLQDRRRLAGELTADCYSDHLATGS
jgi:hypothetical protein